ncbi:MAG: class I SAM-dependent methyltransferase [Kofleriaceae bacterium]|nr:class I SAM-dependent methyltransferase [Myxococcales bacterium]MCB9559896.1 class I SAM-dependent methyltransferase [Kofleriaceae bacterium]MCB9571510.1 class I SAM-dependent methyltransferase [Kofleriaceae bacterium]
MSATVLEAVPCDVCGQDDPVPLITKHGYRVVRCRACDLVYVSPRLKPGGLAALYEGDTYQEHQATRADDTEHDTRWRREALARLALLDDAQPARGKLLDVGCSTGWFMGVARDGGWQVTGLDISRPSVEQARARGFDVHHGTLEDNDLEPGGYAAVTMFDSIEHMPSPMTALRAVRRLLADDGVVVLTTPNIDGLLPRVTWQLFGRTVGAWEHPGPPGHIYQFGKKTLAEALRRGGFTMVHSRTEAIPLDHTVGALEEVLMDALKGKRGRPTADDARTDVEPPPLRSAPPVGVSPVTRMARRAVRRVVRTGAWALTSAITAPAARLDQGDSLLVIARKA